MKTKYTDITLDCGIVCKRHVYSGDEWLEISLEHLHRGYGPESEFELLSKLFAELHAKGYKGTGLHIVTGYYDSIDDIVLNVFKKI